jgi:hypothetical protein
MDDGVGAFELSGFDLAGVGIPVEFAGVARGSTDAANDLGARFFDRIDESGADEAGGAGDDDAL